MIIPNGTLLAIASKPVDDGSGGYVASSPAAVSVRVYVEAPRQSQLIALTNKVSDVTAVMYIEPAQATGIEPGGFVTVRMDEVEAANGPGRIYEVGWRSDRIKAGGLSHVEIYMKGGR